MQYIKYTKATNISKYMYAPYMPLIITSNLKPFNLEDYMYRKIIPRRFGPYTFKKLDNHKKGICKPYMRKIYNSKVIKSIMP